jgi:GNAT superfamily N-acetyltransferase
MMQAEPEPYVTTHTDPAVFANRVQALIRHDPVGCSILATNLDAAIRRGSPRGTLWILVHAGARPGSGTLCTGRRSRAPGTGTDVVLAGMIFPPYPLWLTPIIAEDAAGQRRRSERLTEHVVTALARHLVTDPSGPGKALPGVRAPIESARPFAQAWRNETGRRFRLQMAQRLYQLTELVGPTGVPGTARTATRDNLELCVDWMHAFHDEAVPYERVGEMRRIVPHRIAAGELTLWLVGGRPVAMAGTSATFAGVARIGPVYTPPGQRRHGYGGAVTAAATRLGFTSGARRCMLVTDLANPTPNAIYQRLGYRPTGDAADFAFVDCDPS